MKRIQVTVLFSLMLFFMNVITSNAETAVKISYNITFPEVQAHYADIEMNVEYINQQILVLKMPVWTPGSYLVREFSKSVEGFTVSANDKEIPFVKTDQVNFLGSGY